MNAPYFLYKLFVPRLKNSIRFRHTSHSWIPLKTRRILGCGLRLGGEEGSEELGGLGGRRGGREGRSEIALSFMGIAALRSPPP